MGVAFLVSNGCTELRKGEIELGEEDRVGSDRHESGG